MRIGVDVGGTNTDAALMDGRELVARAKVPTTPDVTSGIISALESVLGQRPGNTAVRAVMLGTTHFTNALLEQRGLAPTAVVRLALPATSLLPPLVDCQQIAGGLSRKWAARLGLPGGCPVVAGAGDGFLATTGSACDTDRRVAVTLGTTASVRRFVTSSATGSDPRTFCYRYGDGRFLSGCAGNNGGNVLEWASHALGPIGDDESRHSPPIFLPFLLGERAPFWDATLGPRWVDVDGSTLSDLRTAVIESQAFQLAAYLELTTRGAAARPKALILSGNGFSHAPIAAKLATLVGMPVLAPIEPGLATIRGAARCGFGAMGEDTHDDVERLVDEAAAIEPVGTPGLDERYGRFRDLYLDLDSDRQPARD